MTLAEFLAAHNITNIPATAFECAWFIRCTRTATHYADAGPIGWVPACDQCGSNGR